MSLPTLCQATGLRHQARGAPVNFQRKLKRSLGHSLFDHTDAEGMEMGEVLSLTGICGSGRQSRINELVSTSGPRILHLLGSALVSWGVRNMLQGCQVQSLTENVVLAPEDQCPSLSPLLSQGVSGHSQSQTPKSHHGLVNVCRSTGPRTYSSFELTFHQLWKSDIIPLKFCFFICRIRTI